MVISHLEVVVVALFWILLKRENKRRDNPRDSTANVHGDGPGVDADLSAFNDMTGKENPNVSYVY
jgi:hypothetical protein